MEKNKIISIITPSYSQGGFIEETIQSILMQKGSFYIDYIIMDGGSKDGTVDVIKKYEDLLKENCRQIDVDGHSFFVSNNKDFKWNQCKGISYRWVSEKDAGQADAINKGIEKSFGEVIGWLNSDDVYYPDVFSRIMKQNINAHDFFYGKGMWISKTGKNLLPYPTFSPSLYSFFYQCTLCQPAVFFTKKIFLGIGPLSNEYYCGFDFEYWMRALKSEKKFLYIDDYFAKSRMYMENKSLANKDTVKDDVSAFKNSHYQGVRLNENKLKKYKYIYDKTFDDVQVLNHKLEVAEKINILFDATVIVNDLKKDGGRSGIFFTAFNILKSMLERSDLNISLFCYSNQSVDLAKVIDSRFRGKKIETLTEKDFLNDEKRQNIDRLDVFLSPIFKIPEEVKKEKNILKYIILYDTIRIIFPEYFPVSQDWLLEMIDEINKEDYYFVISENSKRDFIKHVANIDPKKMKVIHLAASDNFYFNRNEEDKLKIFRKYNLPTDKKYIFSLCTLEPRKNLIMSIKGFIKFINQNKIDDLVFMLGGSHWEKFIEKLEQEISNFDKYKDKIIRVGYIDDSDLSTFFSFSELFVYPSLYEGFGLPVLEAMQCGVPVITSNNSSIPEVIGDAGLMIDPKSEDELVGAFKELYFNEGLKSELSKKGLARAALFSWDRTIDEMVEDMKDKLKTDTHRFNRSSFEKKRFKIFSIKYYLSKDSLYNKICFIVCSPKKFINKYLNKLLSSKLRQPVRKIWHFIKGKKI